MSEIRGCRFCRTALGQSIPLVYCPAEPQILVVSEMPSELAWKIDAGRIWEQGDLFGGRVEGVPHTLHRWLEIEREQMNRSFFWIHRANCAVSSGKDFAFHHCSAKYLHRAIEIVNPKLILTLGKVATKYFFQFDEMESVMNKIHNYQGHDCIVLYHPSGQAAPYHQTAAHRDSLRLARTQVRGILSPR